MRCYCCGKPIASEYVLIALRDADRCFVFIRGHEDKVDMPGYLAIYAKETKRRTLR